MFVYFLHEQPVLSRLAGSKWVIVKHVLFFLRPDNSGKWEFLFFPLRFFFWESIIRAYMCFLERKQLLFEHLPWRLNLRSVFLIVQKCSFISAVPAACCRSCNLWRICILWFAFRMNLFGWPHLHVGSLLIRLTSCKKMKRKEIRRCFDLHWHQSGNRANLY